MKITIHGAPEISVVTPGPATTALPEGRLLTFAVMEVNPAGKVWHFSSPLAMNFFTAEHIADLYAQFGALDRIAQLLVEKTRTEAI